MLEGLIRRENLDGEKQRYKQMAFCMYNRNRGISFAFCGFSQGFRGHGRGGLAGIVLLISSIIRLLTIKNFFVLSLETALSALLHSDMMNKKESLLFL